MSDTWVLLGALGLVLAVAVVRGEAGGIVGVVGIILILAIMLMLDKVPLPLLPLMPASFFIPGFMRRARTKHIKSGKYPSVEAKIFEASLEHHDDGSFAYCKLDFEYTVDGNAYKTTKYWYDKEKTPGAADMIKVYYNPAKPKEVYLEDYTRDAWVPFALGGLAAAFLILIYLSANGAFD
jgi:hypothetical protein